MTALVYPPLQENMTVSDHRHATVRWARRALRPDTAVIIGMGTTAPGSGSLIEIAVIETDRTIRLNTLVNPKTPISPVTRRDRHLTDDMLSGAPSFGQILTDLIAVTDGRSITAYNSATAFATVIGESHRANLDPEHLEDPAAWRSIAQARSNWLGHPDHYFPLPPTPRALGQCLAALSVLEDIAADRPMPALSTVSGSRR